MNGDRPLIVADIGNSAIKVACYDVRDHESLVHEAVMFRIVADDETTWDSLVASLPSKSAQWRVASVRRDFEKQLASWVSEHRGADEYRMLSHVDFPLNLNVDAPERVGTDRLATATAANALRNANRPAIVIDAGTAITVDVLDATGTFQGGVILPGRDAFSRLLATTTDLLPHVEFSEKVPQLPGKSTDEAIAAGAYWGTIGAVKEVVSQLVGPSDADADVFITGGDGERLQRHLDRDTQHVSHLAVMGIALTTTGASE